MKKTYRRAESIAKNLWHAVSDSARAKNDMPPVTPDGKDSLEKPLPLSSLIMALEPRFMFDGAAPATVDVLLDQSASADVPADAPPPADTAADPGTALLDALASTIAPPVVETESSPVASSDIPADITEPNDPAGEQSADLLEATDSSTASETTDPLSEAESSDVIPASDQETSLLDTTESPIVSTLDPSSTTAPEGIEIAFIDPGLQDSQTLIDGIDPRVQIVLLDSTEDGITQITEALSAAGDKISAVHIIGHGSPGTVSIGSTDLTSDTLDSYSDELTTWQSYLTEEADILVYGCDVAEGDDGTTLISSLARITSADFAASTDPTGSSDLGGDWVLEYRTGSIETLSLFNQDNFGTYVGVLGDGDNGVTITKTDAELAAAAQTNEDTNFNFSTLGVDIGDDSTHTTIKVTVTVDSGTLTSGDFSASSILFQGSLINVNTELDNLVFSPVTNTTDSVTVTINVDDLTGGDNSTASREFQLTIAPQPDAPTLTGDAVLDAVAEDSDPDGASVTSLFGSLFSDVDGDTLAGIAIVDDASNSSQGNWEYQISGGGWTSIGSVSATNALLLDKDTLLRFNPAENYHDTPDNLTVRAIDSSTIKAFSTNGSASHATSLTGTDISDTNRSLGTSITAVNDAPETETFSLSVTKNVTLTGINLTEHANDIDGGTNATTDAAITSYRVVSIPTVDQGVLQKADGTPLTDNNTLTLPEASALKFVPTTNYTGDTTFTFQAIDEAGEPSETDTVTITVETFNEAPEVTVPDTETKPISVGEDAPTGIAISGISIVDLDAGDSTIEVTVSTAQSGTITLSTLENLTSISGDETSSVTFQGTLANINTALNNLIYNPALNFNGNDTITVEVNDTPTGGGKTDSESFTVTVTPEDDAPVTGSSSLTDVAEDTTDPAGATVITLLANYSDVDDVENDNLAGVAISADASTSDQGTWQYSIDNGVNWSAVGTISTSQALILSSSAMLRFLPAAEYSGSVGELTIHAIDDSNTNTPRTFTTDPASRQTTNIASGLLDIDATGDTLTTSVTAANDIFEVVTAKHLVVIEGGTATLSSATLQITDVEASASQIVYTIKSLPTAAGQLLKSGTAMNVDNTFTQDDIDNNRITFVHNGTEPSLTGSNLTVGYSVTDEVGGFGTTEDRTVTIDVSPVNDFPVLTQATISEVPILGSKDLTELVVFDPDNTDEQLRFQLTSLPDSDIGTLTIKGRPVAIGSLFSYNELDQVIFTSVESDRGTTSFNVTLRDGAGGVVTDGVSITVQVGVDNQAPDGFGNLTAPDLIEDSESYEGTYAVANAGKTLADYGAIFSDPDNGGSVVAVAVVGNTASNVTQGDWQYSTNTGSTWRDIGSANDNGSALVLPVDALIRFDPVSNYNGTPPALQLRAVDDSYTNPVNSGLYSGTYSASNGAQVYVDTNRNGEGYAISATENTLSISVTPVNDDPSLEDNRLLWVTSGNSRTITGYYLDVYDVDSPDTNLTYTLTAVPSVGGLLLNGSKLAVGQTFTQDDINKSLLIYVDTDSSAHNTSTSFSFTVTDSATNTVYDNRDGGIYIDSEAEPKSTLKFITFNILISDTDPVQAIADANNDSYIITVNTVLNLNSVTPSLLVNDSGPGLEIIEVEGASVDTADGTVDTLANTAHGQVIFNTGTNTFTYTPDTDYIGSDSFTYTIEDDNGETDEATVTITVRSIDVAPVLVKNETLTGNEGSTTTLSNTLLQVTDANEYDTAGQIVYTITAMDADFASTGTLYSYAQVATGQVKGTLNVNDTFTQDDIDNNRIEFRHNGSEQFVTGFTFSFTDGTFPTTDQSFAIDITPVNDAPYFTGSNATQIVKEGESLDLTTLLQASDADGGGDKDTDPATVPLAEPNSLTVTFTDLDTNVAQILLYDDDDFDTYTTVNNGILTMDQVNTGRVRYVHLGGEEETDSFTTTVNDQQSQGNSIISRTIDITLIPVNDDPQIDTNTNGTITDNGDGTVTTTTFEIYEGASKILNNEFLGAVDPDNTTTQVQYRIDSAPANGVLMLGSTTLGIGSSFTEQNLIDNILRYVHDGSETTADSFNFILSDAGGGLEPSGTFDITILPINDAPTIIAPSSRSGAEEQVISITGITISDTDTGVTGDYTATVDLGEDHGALIATASGSANVIDGGTTSLTITGTLADINATLATLTYTGNANFVGSDSIQITVKDGGNTGTDPDDAVLNGLTFSPALTDDGDTNTTYEKATATIALTVTPVNDSPVNTVPGDQNVNEDTPLVFSSANGNTITIADPDIADGGIYTATVSLSVLHGTLTTTVDGSANVSGSGTKTLTVSGSKTDIDATLDGLTYQGIGDYYGSDTLTVTTSDQGNFGVGGVKTDIDTVAITVTEVNDAPTSEDIPSLTVSEDSILTFTLPSSDVGENSITDSETVDRFRIVSLPANGVLKSSVAGGQITLDATWLGGDRLITLAQGTDMTFEPDENFNGTVSFTFQAVDSGDLESSLQTATIIVTAVNDAPEISGLSDSVAYTEGAGLGTQGTPVLLDANHDMQLDKDIELTERSEDNFNSSSLTVRRDGGAVSVDRFSIDTATDVSNGYTISLSGTDVRISGNPDGGTDYSTQTTIATITNNSSSGTLVITFNADASKEAVSAVMKRISYSNVDDNLSGDITVAMTFNDGNFADAQGTGVGSVTGSVTVAVTGTNDSPDLTQGATITAREDFLADPNPDTSPDTNDKFGETVASLLAISFTDPDSPTGTNDSFAGIAITINDSTQGTWEYTLTADGSAGWTSVGTIDPDKALFLNTAARLRFNSVSNANDTTFTAASATPSLTVKAVDNSTSYTSGATITNADGGGSALAADSDAVEIFASITAVNDAPTLINLNDSQTFSEAVGTGVAGTSVVLDDPNAPAIFSDIELVTNQEDNFDGATLRVQDATVNADISNDYYLFQTGGDTGLSILGSPVSLPGSSESTYGDDALIKYNGTTVGKLTNNSIGDGILLVTFNDLADQDAVNAILRNLAFSNADDSFLAGAKTISIVFNDGNSVINVDDQGDDSGDGLSATATVSMTLESTNDAPTLTDGYTIETTEDAAPVAKSIADMLDSQFNDPDGVIGNSLTGVAISGFDDQGLGAWQVLLQAPTETTGLTQKTYDGYFADDVNFFDGLTPDTTTIDTGALELEVPSDSDTFSVEWTGYFKAPEDGSYIFSTTSDDASYVWLGDTAVSGYTTANAVVDNGGLHSSTKESSSPIVLDAGEYYFIRIQYGEYTGGSTFTFSYSIGGGTAVSDLTNDAFTAAQSWVDLGDVAAAGVLSDANALLLSADTQVRFVPDADANTDGANNPTLTVYAVESLIPSGSTVVNSPAISTFTTDATAPETYDTAGDTLAARVAGSSVTIDVDIDARNDAPEFQDGSSNNITACWSGTLIESPVEGVGTPQQKLVPDNASVYDLDLGTTATLADTVFGAGAITVALDAGYSSGDVYSLTANDLDGIATVTGGNGSNLLITLKNTATITQVNSILQAIRYENTSDNPPTGARNYTITLSDGYNSDGTDTASGLASEVNEQVDALSDTLTGSITITLANDPPSLTATVLNPIFTETDAATKVTLFNNAATDTIQDGQTLTELILTVSNLNDGDNEKLTIDGTEISLTDGTTATTTTNSGSAVISVTSGTATITYTHTGLTETETNTLVDSLAYRNTSQDPTDGSRVVTITSLTDNGGADANNDNTAELSITSSVAVISVNDAPDLSATVSGTFTEGDGAPLQFLTAVSLPTDVDADHFNGGSLTVALGGSFHTGDTLQVVSGVNNITVSGATVSYNSNPIGTASYNNATGTLIISFTSINAIPGAVQALAQQIGYSSTSENPTWAGDAKTRSVTVTLNDGGNDGTNEGAKDDLTPVTGSFSVVGINDAPTLSNLDATAATTYTQDGLPVVIDSDAVLSDLDLEALSTGNGNWDGSTLTISRNVTSSVDDLFGASGSLSSIAVANGDIVVSDTIIGTYTNGSGTLEFTFNANATTALVNTTLRSITYSNDISTAGSLGYDHVDLDVAFNDQNINYTTSGTAGTGQDQGSEGFKAINSVITVNINRLPVGEADANSVNEGIAATDTTSTSGNVLTDGTDDSDQDIYDGTERSDVLVVTNAKDSSDGSFTAVSAGTTSTNGSTVDGDYGSLKIGADGSYIYSVDNTNTNVQALAVGETLIDTFTYQASDSVGGYNTVDLTISIDGTNDAPVITDGPDTANLDETDAALTTSGNLSVSDVDTTDVVSATRTLSVTGTSDRDDSAAPNNDTLLTMFTVSPQTILNGTQTTNTLNWSFDSGSETFNYMAIGETLILTYTLQATDDDTTPLSDTETVTITITGTNDTPTIAVEGEDSDAKTLVETNTTLNSSGTLSVEDQDTSDTASVAVSDVSTSGTFSGTLPSGLTASNNQALKNMLTVDIGTIIAADTTSGTINWTFTSGASGDTAFDFLPHDENLILTYTVTVTDDNSIAEAVGSNEVSSVTRTITITITGSNDAPVLNATPDLSTSTSEDTLAPSTDTHGFLVSTLTGGVTDVDENDPQGIAVTALDTTHGTWYYSTDSGSWTEITTAPTDGSAMLLKPDARLYLKLTDEHWNGVITDAVTFRAWDQTSGAEATTADTRTNGSETAFSTATDTLSMTVTPVNDAPTVTLPVSLSDVTENIVKPINGISITDPDSSDTYVANEATTTLTLSVNHGTLTLSTTTSGTAIITSGNGEAEVVLAGLVADINTLLGTDNLKYQSDLNFSGIETLTATVNDHGNVGGGDLEETKILDFTVGGVNDAPVFTAPATLVVDEDSGATNVGTFTIADPDIVDYIMQADISVSHGTLNLTLTFGMTVVDSTSNGDATVHIQGTKAEIEAALDTLTYTPVTNYNGDDTLTVTVHDRGDIAPNTAQGVVGGAVDNTDTKTTSITVTPVNDAPANTAPASTATNEDVIITFNSSNGNLISVNDDFDTGELNSIDSITSTVSVTRGTLTAVSGGGATINSNGTSSVTVSGTKDQVNTALDGLEYSSVPDYNGDDTLTISTSDNGNTGGGILTDTDTVSITIAPVSDITADNLSTAEDTSVIANVITGTGDATADNFEGTPVLTAVTQGTNGSVTSLINGAVTYTPDADYYGSDSFTYTVTSPTGITETATVNVNVTATADVTDDSDSTSEDTAVTTAVLDNDSFSGTTSINSVTQGTHGTVIINDDKTITYTPDDDYNGTDSYTYTVTSGIVTETATVNVTVNAVADIVNDSDTVDEDGIVTTNLLTNDSFEGVETITTITQGANGTVSIINDTTGTVQYTPDADFNGTDSYTYTVTSGGKTETATVNVTVNQINDTATFSGDTSGSGQEDGSAITGTMLVGDSKDGMSTPNFTVSTGATNGTGTINTGTGFWSYTPIADYNGTDSFIVSVTDDDGNTETETINVTVNAVADIVNDSDTLDEDGSITTNVLTNDSFEGVETVTAITQGANGTVSIINATDGTVQYTPDDDFNGTDIYTYTVTSGGKTEIATVNVTVDQVNDTATFSGDTSGSGQEDGSAITGTMAVTDTGDSINTPNFTIATGASNGTASINSATGVWSYTPIADYNGTDSFIVSVTDDDGNIETKAINITVNAIADIVGDTQTVGEDDNVTTSLLANDSFEGNESITAITQGSNGSVAIVDANTGTVKYTPDADFNGTDSYTYTVTSGGKTETATVNVTVTTATDITADTLTTAEDTPISANVITGTNGATADNFEGTPSITSVTQGSNGTVTFQPNGTISYTPDSNYNGSDSFTYTVTSPAGVTETATVSVIVTAVDDLIETDEILTAGGTLIIGDVNSPETVLVQTNTVGTYGTFSIDEAGVWSYTTGSPHDEFVDGLTYTDTFTVQSADSTITTVTINILGTNDLPVLSEDIAELIETDEILTTTGSLTVSDVDNPETFQAQGGTVGTYGTFSIGAGGAWSYTTSSPHDEFIASVTYTDTFTVASDDGTTTTVTINILGTSEAPVINLSAQSPSTQSIIQASPEWWQTHDYLQEYPQEDSTELAVYPMSGINNPDQVYTDWWDAHKDSLDLFITPSSQIIQVNETGSFSIPSGTFKHTDPNVRLKIEATMAGGGPLPSWLIFDPVSGRFDGAPPLGSEGIMDIKISAYDQEGNVAFTQFSLYIVESPAARTEAAWATDSPFYQGETGQTTLSGEPELSVNDIVTFGDSTEMSLGSYGLYLANSVTSREITINEPTAFNLPAGLFRHSDANARVTLEATLADGSPLPKWITFDSSSGRFVVNAPEDAGETIDIRIIASDQKGNEAETHFLLLLREEQKDDGENKAVDRGRHAPAVSSEVMAIMKGRPSLSEQLASYSRRM